MSAQVIGSADFQVLFLQILVKLFYTFSWEAFTYWTSQQQKLLAPAGKFVGPIPDNQTGSFFKPCTNFFVIKMMHACWLAILVFLVFKAWLSLQVHNNSHLYHHGNIGNSQTLSGICWKSSGKGESNTSNLLCCDLRFYIWECYCPLFEVAIVNK